MLKNKQIIGIIVCVIALVLVSWSKFIFTGSIKVDDNPLGNIEGWIVFISYTGALFLFGRLYYLLYKNQEKYSLSHHQVKIWGYIMVILSSLMLPILSNDIFIYIAYGDASNHGVDVFTQTDVVQYSQWFSLVGDWKDAPYSYGPFTLWLSKIANCLGGNNIWGVLIAYKIIWLVIAISFIEIMSLSIKNLADFIWISLSPILWLQCVGSIHYDLLAGLFLVISIYFITQQKIVFSLVAISMAIMSKMVFIIFVPFIIGHYFFINPQRLNLKAVLYFMLGLMAFSLVTIISYWPFWNGVDTLKVPFAFLNKVEPSKSFSEVAGELLNLAFPKDISTSLNNELTGSINSESKKWWWKQCQFIMNIFGMILAIVLTIIFLIKTRLKLNKQVLAEYWVKLTLIFFFFYSHVFNIWYLIVVIPFIPLLGNNVRFKKYLLVVAVFSNLHMIMLNIDHETFLYLLNPPIIFINISMFIWQFKKNFLTIESPVIKAS